MSLRPSTHLSLGGRLSAAYAALRGKPARARANPRVGDFTPISWAGRRMTPEQVRWTLEAAIGGNLREQWALFDLMEDSWPRLAKNLSEVRRAAVRTGYRVQAYARRGEKPTASAQARAELVEAALVNWWPRPGTLELSFEDALYAALDALGKGLSVLEVSWQRHEAGLLPRCAHLLPPAYYGWNGEGTELGLVGRSNPGVRAQSADGKAPAWEPFPEGQFWVGVWHGRSGAPGQTALLRCLAPYWCGITFGWEWLMNNAQIFGVPLRWATYDADRPELLPTIEAMLENVGAAGWAAFPDGTSMEFKEAVQRAADNPQVYIQTLADKYCDQLILGQEGSSESKPAGIGSGASDLHQGVRGERLRDAAQWCADLLNYQLVPALLRYNWGDDDEPPTILPDFADETDHKAMAERDEILGRIAPLPTKWFYERHAIPHPEPGEATVGGTATAQATDEPDEAENLPEDGPEEPEGDKVAARAPNPAARRGERPSRRSSSPPRIDPARLHEARGRDLAALRAASAPLLDAIEAGELGVVGELEAFISRLDAMAPAVMGAGALADALESALAQAAIAGAAGAYAKLETLPKP